MEAIEVQTNEVIFTETSSKPSLLQNIKNILRNITVEPIALLSITPKLICSLALENLFLEKACLVNLSLNETICQAMVLRDRSGYAPEDEVAVQRVVSKMLPYKSAGHIIQIFFILMIGSWSDRTGRRRSMFIVPYISDIISILGYLLCVYFFLELSVEYPVLIEAMFSISLGGIPLLMAGMYSYIAGITDTKSRTVRVGVVSMTLRTSMTLGIALSGFMFRYLGFYGVFLSALGMNLIGFVYIFVVVKSVQPNKKYIEEGENVSCCRLLWNGIAESVMSSLEVCFKSGPNRRRTKMILLQLVNILSFGIMTAEGSVLYLFSRKQFGWDEVDYSIFKSYKTFIEIMGCAFTLAFFSRYLRWNDVQIALLSCLSRFIGTFIMAFAKNGILLYIATLIDIFNGVIIISVRSMITKTVDQNEQALANSLTGLLDAFGSFLMGSLYAYVYYQTLAIFPGVFFLVSLFSYIPILLMLLMIKNIAFSVKNDGEVKNED
ncbi:proton-coupled folate transporter-like isoform X2 [Coccinella septempunctata]|nr:proton-coupled folate transporter-like isoform X2 [Coccinella septempunctata]